MSNDNFYEAMFWSAFAALPLTVISCLAKDFFGWNLDFFVGWICADIFLELKNK